MTSFFEYAKRALFGAGYGDAVPLDPEQVMTVHVGGRAVDMYFDTTKQQYLPIYTKNIKQNQDRQRLVGYNSEGKPLIVTVRAEPDRNIVVPAAALNFPAEPLTEREVKIPKPWEGIHGHDKQKRKAMRLRENDFVRKNVGSYEPKAPG